MKKIEALADAIIAYTDSQKPDSAAYQARNPLALKSYTVKHPKDENGLRVFKSLLDGYQAALYDLEVKCSGKSRSKVKSDSNILDLIRSYGLPDGTARVVAKFLKSALHDDSIDEFTAVSTFLEN